MHVTRRAEAKAVFARLPIVEFGGPEHAIFLSTLPLESTIACDRGNGKTTGGATVSACSITKDAKRWPSDSYMAPATGW